MPSVQSKRSCIRRAINKLTARRWYPHHPPVRGSASRRSSSPVRSGTLRRSEFRVARFLRASIKRRVLCFAVVANLLILPMPRLALGHFIYGIASQAQGIASGTLAEIDEALGVRRLAQLSELPLTLGVKRSSVLALAIMRPQLVADEIDRKSVV